MKKLSTEQLLKIYGGSTLTYSLINSISKVATTIYEIGKAFGSSIRRIIGGSYCPMS